MKYKIICEEKELPELVKKLEKVGGKVVSIDAIDEEEIHYKFWIDVVPFQDGGKVIVLAYADNEGIVHSFHPNFQWNPDKIEDLDFKRCDRCEAKHNRARLYFLELPDGKHIQVGGSCAKQYNCDYRVSQLLKDFKEISIVLDEYKEEECSGGGSHHRAVDIVEAAFFIFSVYGYLSGKNSIPELGQVSSKERVLALLHGDGDIEEFRKFQKKQDKYELLRDLESHVDQQIAESKNDFSEFLNNCKVYLGKGGRKSYGYLVAVSGIYWKSQQIQAEAKNYKKPDIGKVEVKAKVSEVKIVQGDYGSNYCVTLIDENYGKILFYSNAKGISDLEAGNSVKGIVNIKSVKENISFANRPKLQLEA